MEMIIGRHGTQKINITDPTVSRQHCKLTSNNDGTFTLENLSNQGTKVDGVDVIRTTVKLDSKVQLSSTFSVTVAELLGVNASANGLAAANGEQKQVSETNGKQAHVEEKTVSIAHLRDVYKTFEDNKLRIQIEARRRANKKNFARMVPSFILTGISILVIIFGDVVGSLKSLLGIISAAALLFSALKWKNADVEDIEETSKNIREFQTKWVCPICKNPLPQIPYKAIVNKGSCNYCKIRWKE
jgi:hypothetical protein